MVSIVTSLEHLKLSSTTRQMQFICSQNLFSIDFVHVYVFIKCKWVFMNICWVGLGEQNILVPAKYLIYTRMIWAWIRFSKRKFSMLAIKKHITCLIWSYKQILYFMKYFRFSISISKNKIKKICLLGKRFIPNHRFPHNNKNPSTSWRRSPGH